MNGLANAIKGLSTVISSYIKYIFVFKFSKYKNLNAENLKYLYSHNPGISIIT